MPSPTLGVIDVAADEARGLLYVVTCEDEHWMVGRKGNGAYRTIGPMLIDFATTLIDAQGRAHAITADFDLATYDPVSERVSVRRLRTSDGESLLLEKSAKIPTWVLSPDRRTAYLIRLGEATLFHVDLEAGGDTVAATPLATMVEGKNPDSRS